MEPLNLSEVISQVIEDIGDQIGHYNRRVNVLFCNREKDILIEADKGKLTQVICNILSNAIKFTEDGTININVEKKDIISSTGNNDNENRQGVIINIKDTGVGIDSQIFPKLFSKFMGTSDTRGSGLGLFISKSIVEAHGGRIKQFLRKKANRIYTLRTDSHKMHQEVLLATKNHSLEFLPSCKAYYGSTVIVTYDGALSACPLFTINWNVNAVVFVTNGGTKVALALLSFDNNTTGPPANWSHKNLSELPDRLELLVASSVT